MAKDKIIEMLKKTLDFYSISLLLMISGCANAPSGPPSYFERMSSVYISEDNKSLAVFTDDYHYIFDTPKKLSTIIRSGYADILKVKFNGFHVEKDNNISGDVNLMLRTSNTTKEQMTAAHSYGFTKIDANWLTYNAFLKGTRYKSMGIKPKFISHKLSRFYSVRISDVNLVRGATSNAPKTPIVNLKNVMHIGQSALILGVFTVCAIKDGCTGR